MAISSSVAGKATIKHEAGDTLRRTFQHRYKTSGLPLDFTGAAIEFIISNEEDGEPLYILTNGSGLKYSNLLFGEFKINWQTRDKLEPRMTYWYKTKVTYPDGRIKTYLESKLRTL
jgi:hypothetical protein